MRTDNDDVLPDYNTGVPAWALVCVLLGLAGAVALVVMILIP